MNGDGSAIAAMLGLPGMLLLAVLEFDGELEQVVQTTAGRLGARAAVWLPSRMAAGRMAAGRMATRRMAAGR